MGTKASSTLNSSREWKRVFLDFVCVITLMHKYLPWGCQNNSMA